MTDTNSTYGLIMCGGNSARMGTDKAMLVYHEKSQCYHLYDLVQGICDLATLSCSPPQARIMDRRYPTMPDLPEYGTIGPMAGLLTGFAQFPGKNFLVIGCDYPLLTKNVIQDFYGQILGESKAAAFYSEVHDLYEPLLAWYSSEAGPMLADQFGEKDYSLQHFLHAVRAQQYRPADRNMMISIDTPEGRRWAQQQLINSSKS
jgi:molybdopterin-guanine dinucleotide biosynthesis protein A